MKCHNCDVSGHLAKHCHKPKRNKNYCSFCNTNNHDRSAGHKLKNGTSTTESAKLLRKMNSAEEKDFCFFASSDNNVLATKEDDMIIDSGCTNYRLKNRQLFATIDESFSGSVGCANSFESEIKGNSGVEFYVCEDNGKRATIGRI